MPVSWLLCEGGDRSPDVRVLRKLLTGRGDVLPSGTKHGMETRIISRREMIGKDEVFGILDGDFVESWTSPVQQPVEWRSPDGTIFFNRYPTTESPTTAYTAPTSFPDLVP